MATSHKPNVLAIQTLAGLAHSYAHMFVLLYATVVLVLEREWGLDYDSLFALSLPMTVMFGAGAVPAGWLGDRWSETGMLKLFFFGLGAATVLTGFARTQWEVAGGLAAMGLFASIYHPVAIPWLVRQAPNRGRALGINGVFGSAGTAAAALVAGALAQYVSWRAAFVVPGLVCMATGLVFVFACRDGRLKRPAAAARPVDASLHADIKRVFVVLAVTVLCTGMVYQMTSFALPKIFEQRIGGLFDGDLLGVGAMVTLVYLIGGLSQIVGGELCDRFRLRTLYVTLQFLQVPVLVVAFALVSPALVPAAGLMVALNVAGQPAENVLLARYTPDAWQGRVFGAKFLLTLGVSAGGVALIPIVYRLAGSLDPLFAVLIGFALAAGLAGLLLPRGESPRAEAVQPLAAE